MYSRRGSFWPRRTLPSQISMAGLPSIARSNCRRFSDALQRSEPFCNAAAKRRCKVDRLQPTTAPISATDSETAAKSSTICALICFCGRAICLPCTPSECHVSSVLCPTGGVCFYIGQREYAHADLCAPDRNTTAVCQDTHPL